jgi:hypothetical protein
MKYFLTLFISLIIFAGCGDNNETPIVKDITSIKIDEPKITKLYVTRNDINFTAKAFYNDGSSADITEYISWYFDDSKFYDYAAFSNGSMYAVANGDDGNETTVKISANYRNLSDTLNTPITIIPAKSISIDDSNISDENNVSTDTTYKLYADVNFTDGNTTKVGKNNSKNITWEVEGDATIISTDDGILEIQFSSGESNVTVSVFDINSTKTYKAN